MFPPTDILTIEYYCLGFGEYINTYLQSYSNLLLLIATLLSQ